MPAFGILLGQHKSIALFRQAMGKDFRHRGLFTNFFIVLDRDIKPGVPHQGGQMQHDIGRAARCVMNAHSIGKILCQDIGNAQLFTVEAAKQSVDTLGNHFRSRGVNQ